MEGITNLMNQFIYTITTEDKNEGLTIKDIVKKRFDFSTRLRNKIKRNSMVYVNDKAAVFWTSAEPGDVVKVCLPEETNTFIPENIPLDILFEDEHLLIINKSPGIVAHPTKGQPNHTLSNAIAFYLQESKQNFKIRFINRIDMDTSGIIMISKTSYAQAIISKEMKANNVSKEYIALVFGNLEKKVGTINFPIGRPSEDSVARAVMIDGQEAITHYSVTEEFRNGKFSLLSLKLETGRTHQIRVHLSHIGHPIVGDYLYGGEFPILIERQALHASSISFTHPITKKRVTLNAPLPTDISNAITYLKDTEI